MRTIQLNTLTILLTGDAQKNERGLVGRVQDLEAAHQRQKNIGLGIALGAGLGGTSLGASLYAIGKKLGLWSLALVLIAGATMIAARSAPPPVSDPNSPRSQWYRSLMKPGTQTSCCGEADCRPTDTQQTATGWQAWVDKRWGVSPADWVDIPADKILQDVANAEDKAVLCYRSMTRRGREDWEGEPDGEPTISSKRVLCFVRPTET